MPALPVADFVSCQAGLALGSLDAFLNAVLGFGDAVKFGFLGVGARIRQVVIGLDNASVVAIPEADHNQRFFVAFLPLVRAARPRVA